MKKRYICLGSVLIGVISSIGVRAILKHKSMSILDVSDIYDSKCSEEPKVATSCTAQDFKDFAQSLEKVQSYVVTEICEGDVEKLHITHIFKHEVEVDCCPYRNNIKPIIDIDMKGFHCSPLCAMYYTCLEELDL